MTKKNKDFRGTARSLSPKSSSLLKKKKYHMQRLRVTWKLLKNNFNNDVRICSG